MMISAFHAEIHFLLRHMTREIKRKKTQYKNLTKVKTCEKRV
jgi:uncharacterized membrane protein YciS (DUF1049 family)